MEKLFLQAAAHYLTNLHFMFRLAAIFLLSVIPFVAFSQTGTISGTVKDDSTGRILSEVTVGILNSTTGTLSDSSGHFEISHLAPGKYDLVFIFYSYKNDTLKNINVVNDSTEFINEKLVLDKNLLLKEVAIRDFKEINSDVALINDIKNSAQITSGISSEQISKGQDRDAAESVRRIPGVSMNDDRFIIIRGLNERYNAVWMNNSVMPSTEPDKRSFSFDVIPSSFIDRMIIYKTPSADLPGDFAGGMVNVITKTAPVGQIVFCDFNGFYRPGSTFKQLEFTQGSKTDFLGYDNGFRKIPDGVPSYIETSSAELTKLFKNTWVMKPKTAMPDFRFDVGFSEGKKFKHFQIGNMVGIYYFNQSSLYDIARKDYEDGKTIEDVHDIESTDLVRLGAIENFSIALNSGSKFEFKNFFNQAGRNQTTERTGTDGGNNTLFYGFGYLSRTIYSSQFEYSYNSPNGKTECHSTFGYAYDNRLEPDFRRITYQFPPDTFFRSNVPPGSGQLDVTEGGTRYFSVLNENIYSFNQSFKQKIKIFNYTFSVAAGGYIEYKTRIFSSRLFGYTLPVSYLRRSLTGLPVDQIFSPQYVDVIDTSYNQNRPVGFRIGEATGFSNSYQGQNQLLAPYASVDFSFLKRFNLLSGLRYENNIQSVQAIVGVDSLNVKTQTKYFLPSFNLKCDLTKKTLLRFAYGKTLNRPEFREWTPFSYYDFELMALSHGTLFPSVLNPRGFVLQTARIDNYDLRYEFYPSPDEMIHIGFFVKNFINPIEQVDESLVHRTGLSKEITFQNGKSAYCDGIEVECRKNLSFLDSICHTKIFGGFNIIANASLIKSEVHYQDTLIKARPLQGQSPYLVNAGIYYSNRNDKFNVSIIYNVIGPRIFLAGGTAGAFTTSGPSIGEMPRNVVDVSFNEKITSHFSLSCGINNLLNQPIVFMEDSNGDGKFSKNGSDQLIMSYKKASYYSLGMKMIW